MCGFNSAYRDINVCYMEEQFLILLKQTVRKIVIHQIKKEVVAIFYRCYRFW